jgi:PAS domain S-box-containing protein
MKPSKEGIAQIVEIVTVCIILSIIAKQNYLIFHSLVEIFSIVIFGSIFFIMWSGRKLVDQGYLLLIGISSFFIGIIDSMHLLAFQGMSVFTIPTYSGPFLFTLASQLWIGARFIQATSLLAAAVLIGKKINSQLTFASYTLITTLFFASIFYWHNFPVTFISGGGLTSFKVLSEYVIACILILAIIIFTKKRSQLEEKVFFYLIASILVFIASEITLTFYENAISPSNEIGHLLKVVSVYLFLKGCVETVLLKPRETLFQEMDENIRKSEKNFRSLFESSTDAIMTLNANTLQYINANKATLKMFQAKSINDFMSLNLWSLSPEKQPDGSFSEEKAKEMASIAMKVGSHLFEWMYKKIDGEPFSATVILTRIDGEVHPFLLATIRDTTKAKGIESELRRKFAEIEKMNTFMINREIKMAELKEKIKSLQ